MRPAGAHARLPRMAKTKVAEALVGAPTMKAQYVLEVRHIQALRHEALKRAGEAMEREPGTSAPRPDASAVLRSVLDEWLAKGGKR